MKHGPRWEREVEFKQFLAEQETVCAREVLFWLAYIANKANTNQDWKKKLDGFLSR